MIVNQDLHALIAVVEAGGIRAAAARLGRTQSAVSQAVRRLEEALGLVLLDRTAYRLRLTPPGEVFVRRAMPFLRQADDLQNFAKVLAAGTEERVRLSLHGAVSARFWGPLVDATASAYPETVMELRPEEVDVPRRRLLDGDADLALLVSNTHRPDTLPTESRSLGQIAFVNVVHTDHLSWEILPQMIVSDFAEASPSYGVREGHRHWRVGSHALKIDAIMRGIGWGWVPEELAASALAEGTLRLIENAQSPGRAHNEVRLYRLANRAVGPVTQAIWDAAPAMSFELSEYPSPTS